VTGNLRLGFHAPNTLREISDLVAEAANAKIPLEVRGRGSKYEVGRYIQSGSVVSTEHLVGISLYEPTELVMSAAAGTPLDDIRNILAEHGQQLAFEPIDLGPALGTHTGQSSIGGVFLIWPLAIRILPMTAPLACSEVVSLALAKFFGISPNGMLCTPVHCSLTSSGETPIALPISFAASSGFFLM